MAFRRRFLKLNPQCYCCANPATVVDHLEPSKGRKDVFERTGNHIPLCEQHHNTVTGKFDYKFAIGSSLDEKCRYLAETRASNELAANRKFPSIKVIQYR